MKVIEIVGNKVLEVPTIVEKQLKNGVIIKALELGESGRGSNLTLIPIPKFVDNRNIINLNFQIGKTKSGNIRLNIIKSIDNSNDVIVLLKPTYGFRGGVKFNLNGIETLASGKVSQGDAGKMGGNLQHLIILKDTNIITYRRTGRLYGGYAEWVVGNNKGNIFCIPKEEYNLLEYEENDID
jgi:hypothetical protein